MSGTQPGQQVIPNGSEQRKRRIQKVQRPNRIWTLRLNIPDELLSFIRGQNVFDWYCSGYCWYEKEFK